MSSHHIVKDNQEPALVIESCPAGYDSPLGELLEWSPLVVVLDEALQQALSLGFKIDVAVVPYAYAERYTDMLQHQLPVQVLTYQHDDDPMTTALNYLRAKRTHAVSVLTGGPPAWQAWERFAETMDTVVFFENTRWSYIRSGHFEKWLPAGMHVSTLPANLDHRSEPGGGHLTLRHQSPFWVGISQ